MSDQQKNIQQLFEEWEVSKLPHEEKVNWLTENFLPDLINTICFTNDPMSRPHAILVVNENGMKDALIEALSTITVEEIVNSFSKVLAGRASHEQILEAANRAVQQGLLDEKELLQMVVPVNLASIPSDVEVSYPAPYVTIVTVRAQMLNVCLKWASKFGIMDELTKSGFPGEALEGFLMQAFAAYVGAKAAPTNVQSPVVAASWDPGVGG